MEDDKSVEEVLCKCSPAVRDLVDPLRELVRTAAPEATEKGYTGWGNLVCDHNGMFCYIAPLKESANLGFHRGWSCRIPRDCCEAPARVCGTSR